MKRSLILMLVVLAIGAFAAADTFSLSGSGVGTRGNTLTISGTGSGNSLGPGQTWVTGFTGVVTISGTVNETDGVSLLFGGPDQTSSPSLHWIFDNVLNAGDPHLDIYGLGFMIGGREANLFYDPDLDEFGSYYVLGISDMAVNKAGRLVPEFFGLDDFRTDVQETPEPGSLMLLGTGLLGLTATIRRKIAA